MPCMPLMVYALHAMHFAKDEASRSQTLDMILDDLEQEPTLTEERRRAAPFLHCFQLHPLQPRSEESDTDSTGLLVWSSPTTYLDDVEGTQTTRYCIVEHHNRPGSVQAPSRRVPFYDQGAQGPVTLWRIPMRSPGSFFGNAATAMVDKRAYPRLYEVFENLKFTLKYERGLPRGFVPEGGRKS
ncbi:hypothetical protein PENSPDRAFT_362893 [Peniophora sp. CONT]|nr:hypothetical protein PENSPDRAFT_362893 [Peniophora sp. CONT]